MRRFRPAVVATIMLAGLLALGACAQAGGPTAGGSAPPVSAAVASGAPSSPAAASNRPAAVAAASAMIASFVPPPGAARLSGAPVGARGLTSSLVGPGTSTVMQTRWYAVPGTPEHVLAALVAPKGATRGDSSMGGGPNGAVEEQDFDFPPVVGVLYSRELTVAAMSVGGRTVLRVDAQVVFSPVRAPSSRISATVTEITVEYRPGQVGPQTPKAYPVVTMSDATQVAAIVQALNDATVWPEGLVMPCPFDGGARMTLTFLASGVAAGTAVIDPAGCGEITVMPVGGTKVTLVGGAALAQHIAKVLGVSWPPLTN